MLAEQRRRGGVAGHVGPGEAEAGADELDRAGRRMLDGDCGVGVGVERLADTADAPGGDAGLVERAQPLIGVPDREALASAAVSSSRWATRSALRT